MDLSIALYQIFNSICWTMVCNWYQAMSEESVLTADTNIWDEEEVASAAENDRSIRFGLPSGVLTMRDNYMIQLVNGEFVQDPPDW